MQAMVLAAGKGSRLGKYTKNTPKALVKLDGETLLESLIKKLIAVKVTKIVINTHHFAEQISDFLKHRCYNAEIIISYESQLLDTGGGLKKALPFFNPNQDILLYNVDILSSIDIKKMMSVHVENKHLATLAVQKRDTTRYLLFDVQNRFCGKENTQTKERTLISNLSSTTPLKRLAFSGIHVISPHIFPYFPKEDVFSIHDLYFSAALDQKPIMAYRHDQDEWTDTGKIEVLEKLMFPSWEKD